MHVRFPDKLKNSGINVTISMLPKHSLILNTFRSFYRQLNKEKNEPPSFLLPFLLFAPSFLFSFTSLLKTFTSFTFCSFTFSIWTTGAALLLLSIRKIFSSNFGILLTCFTENHSYFTELKTFLESGKQNSTILFFFFFFSESLRNNKHDEEIR